MRKYIVMLVAASCSVPLHADQVEVEEVLVVGERDSRIYELAETVDVVPDSAALLRKAVGATIVSNGPLTGIAQIRGMSRFRISTQVNGAVVSSGGPNWMDPPLSYAPAAHLESLEVYRGIAPVGAGQETIGGVINANSWSGEFGDSGVRVAGRLRTGAQSVNHGSLLSAAASIGNYSHRFRLSGLSESGDDAGFDDGEILPTEYQRDRFDMGYGLRLGEHTFQFDYGKSETGDAGTPALPMDIQYIDADLMRFSWDYQGSGVQLTGRLHVSDIEHGMTNYHLRQAPMAASMWRRNIATGENRGFVLTAQTGGWKFGVDGNEEVHDSDIDNLNNPMFFMVNFHDAERRVLGVFAEREQSLGDGWLAEFGLRFNNVTMDSQDVNATPAMMGMAPAVALRDDFNRADRSQSDNNVDWVAKVYFLTVPEVSYYAGMSRKSRSPAYQERYLWMPMQATAGLADGRTYTGNIDLEPEVAHEIELGIDWQRSELLLSPRVFYRDVSDYIQGTESSNMNAIMFVQMMNMMNGTSNAPPLEFNNVDARFYGFDVDWKYDINERWSLNGVVNYVRGKRDDVTDDLYRLAPLSGFVALNYRNANWGLTLESFWRDEQTQVSTTNGESESNGYGLMNLKGFWNITSGLKLGFGVDNLADRTYRDHLSGVNRVMGNADIALGERLPGYGRSVFARLDYAW